MTDHTYAGYTAVQIRAAAEAAPMGPWSSSPAIPKSGFCAQVWGSDGTDLMTADATLAGSSAVAFVATAQPATVLALLDRIAELEADKRALRIDAERYRWIRDKERFHVDGECGDAEFSSSMCCAEEFDDALDAAMTQPAE